VYYVGGTPTYVRSSGNLDPLHNKTDSVDPISGGRFTLELDDTSTPKVTELAGTIFALVNTTPVVAVTGPADSVAVGESAEIQINYQAVGAPETPEIAIAWGDGSVTSAAPTSSGVITTSHTYASAGTYTVRVTVIDTNDDFGIAEWKYIVVYKPDSGYITGGGWIQSAAGAYRPDPALTGKANFGFSARQQNGSSIPVGQTQFSFHVANLNFHSTGYESLVIAGSRAQFKGTGTINGAGDYDFMLTAQDGSGPGGRNEDKFRIKIWDRSQSAGGGLIYDNVHGADDNVSTGGLQTIGGGSINLQRR
jgi:hypothetical protein